MTNENNAIKKCTVNAAEKRHGKRDQYNKCT